MMLTSLDLVPASFLELLQFFVLNAGFSRPTIRGLVLSPTLLRNLRSISGSSSILIDCVELPYMKQYQLFFSHIHSLFQDLVQQGCELSGSPSFLLYHEVQHRHAFESQLMTQGFTVQHFQFFCPDSVVLP